MPPALDLQHQLPSDPAYTYQETVVPYGAIIRAWIQVDFIYFH